MHQNYIKKGISKIKNQKLRKILDSDLTNTALNYGQAHASDKLD